MKKVIGLLIVALSLFSCDAKTYEKITKHKKVARKVVHVETDYNNLPQLKYSLVLHDSTILDFSKREFNLINIGDSVEFTTFKVINDTTQY